MKSKPKQNEALIVTAAHKFPPGISRPTKFIRTIIASLGKCLIDILVRISFREFESSLVLSCKSTQKILGKHGIVNSRIYETESFTGFHYADFQQWYDYADEVENWSLDSSNPLQLSRHGISLLRVFETRWLVELEYFYLANFEVTRREVESGNFCKIILMTGCGFTENVAEFFAKKNGIKISRLGGWPFNFLLGIVERIENYHTAKSVYKLFTRHWRSNTGPKIDCGLEYIQKKTSHRVMIVAYKGRTVARARILISKLKEMNLNFDIVMLSQYRGSTWGCEGLINEIKASGINVVWAEDLITPAEVELVHSNSKSILLRYRAHLEKIPKFFYKTFPIHKFIHPFLEELIREMHFVGHVNLEVANRSLDLIKPDFIIHFEEWDLNRALSLLAKQRKIGTAFLNSLTPMSIGSLLKRLPEYLLSTGRGPIDCFQDAGMWTLDGRSLAVGDPLNDEKICFDKSKIFKKLSSSFGKDLAEKKCVLILCPFIGDLFSLLDAIEFYKRCLEATRSLDVHLIFKVHPQVKVEFVSSILNKLQNGRYFIVRDFNLVELASCCEFSIAAYSTGTTQILQANIPVISILPENLTKQIESIYFYSRSGMLLFTYASPILDIARACERLLFDKEYVLDRIEKSKLYLEYHAGPNDGKSSERIGRFLEDWFEKSDHSYHYPHGV